MKSKHFLTTGPRETGLIARDLAKELAKKKPSKNSLVIGLSGELGTGKTTFIKSFIRALGVKKKVTSPTFLILRRFKLPKGGAYKNVFHIDAYRLKESKELKEVGIKDVVSNPTNIVLVEWADKVRGVLPKEMIWLKFKHTEQENERQITIN